MYLKRILTYSILSLIALGGFFGNIHIETQDNQTNSITISYDGNATYAAEADCPGKWDSEFGCPGDYDKAVNGSAKTTPSSSEAVKMYNSAIDILNLLLGVVSVIVSPAIIFAGWLLSPDWTSGDLFGLRAPMYALWVTVSNIVYFIYAILLILIALGTMFGQDKFSYKVMLPKLALGILMVPFTWWFVQWTISISSVVTASVMTIPYETMGKDGNKNSQLWTTASIPKNIVINETGSGKTETKKCPDNCISPEDFLKNSAGTYGPMMVYAYSIFKFQDVKKLNTITDILKAGVGIVHQGIIAAIMFIVFGILTLALIAMLIVRAIKLWIYAIFSPLFTFRFVAGSNLLGGDKDDSFTIKEFIGLAFVPAVVGLTLSFGLIMVNAVSSAKPDAGPTGKTCSPTEIIKPEGCELMSIMGNPANKITRRIDQKTDSANPTTINTVIFGGITIDFIGKAGPAQTEADSSNTATGVLNSAGGIFGTIIIDIIALIFIWMAFMAAKTVSKAVEVAVSPFEDMGKKIGSLAASIPKYTPIPGLGMSMSGMEKGIGKVEQSYKDNRTNEDAKTPLGQLLGLEAAARKETVKAIENIRTTNQAGLTNDKIGEAMKQISLESKGNKAEKTADLMNAILEKYANEKDPKTGKITGFKNEIELQRNLSIMNIKDTNLQKIKEQYLEKGSISKGYLENDGSHIYKTIHKNEENISGTVNPEGSSQTGGSPKTPGPTGGGPTPPVPPTSTPPAAY